MAFIVSKVNIIPNETIITAQNISPLQRRHYNFPKVPAVSPVLLVLVLVLTAMVASVTSAPTSATTAEGAVGELVLLEGRYHGLRIDISDNIPQEDCRTVLNGLKSLLEAWSSALHVATNRRASLGSATIVTPSKWSSRPCLLPITPDHISKIPIQNAQIRVETPHAVFGDLPYVQQSGGCGQSGDYLQMGVGFIALGNSTSDQLGLAGRLLVAEWAKYRWGVFSEASQGHDATYPPYWYTHDGEWLPSVCSNGVERPLPPFCLPETDHLCTWQPQPQHNATSSLLSMPHLQQVVKLCSRSDHNREVPTKQNHLCQGRSAWEVMELSQDFAHGRNPSGPSVLPAPPQLYFVSRPRLRFILLVEDSDIMNVQRRWEFVRKAVRRVMVYDLPDGAEAGVVVFNIRSREAAPLARLESVTDLRERVGSSLPRNPATAGARDTCVMCGLRQSLDTLREGGAETHGANIIMITSGSHSRKNEAKEVEKLLTSEGLRLVLLLYPVVDRPGRPAPTHALAEIAKKSGGSVITVMDEGVGNDSKVSMLVSLMEALRAAVMVGGATTPALVHSHSYPGGRASLAEGSFVLDDTLGRGVRFAVYYYSLAHVGNTIKLTGPSGSTFASVSLQEEDQDVNMIFVSLREAERGVWRYHVENRADSHQALHIQVTSDNKLDNPVSVRVWTSQDRSSDVHQPATYGHTREKSRATAQAVIIYGEIKINGIPVMGAAVMAILQRLGTNSTGGTYPAIKVPLLDLGTGEPDITRGDGVYSRYAPILAGPARYSITLKVDAGQAVIPLPRPQRHDYRHQHKITDMQMPSLGEGGALGGGCCGSSLPYTDTRQAPPFTRHLTGPTIEVTTNTATSDAIMAPPSRITDLIAWVNSTSGKIVLEWTSVGSTWDWGMALQYEGIVADKIADARRCRGTHLRGLPSNPAPAGQRETVTLEIYISENLGKWICIRALSQHGLKGSPSNPAGAWPPRPHGHEHATIGARGEGLTTREDMQKHTEKIAVISGCLIGTALIVILVFGYCYFFPVALIKKINKRNQSLDDISNKGAVVINGRSPSRMSDSRGSAHGSPDVAKIEVIPLTTCTTQNDTIYDQQTKESGVNTNLTGLNHNKNKDGSMKSTLSMSIPDVTKVQVPVLNTEEPITPEMNQKFYTLGHSPSKSNRSPLRLRGTEDGVCSSNETQPHKYNIAETQNIDDSKNNYYSPAKFDDPIARQNSHPSQEKLMMLQGADGQYCSPYPSNPFSKNYDPSYHPHPIDAHQGLNPAQQLQADSGNTFNNQPMNYLPDNAYGAHSVPNQKELSYNASQVLNEASHSPKPTSRGGSRRGSYVDQRYFSLPRHGMKERLSYHSSQESFSSQGLNDDRNSPPPPPAPEDRSNRYHRHSIALM